MKNKKGYYFIIDSLIAAMILVIGFILISSLYISEPSKIEIKSAADNIMNFLSTVKLNDLCSENKCSDPALQSNYDLIKNKDNSLLEVIGELIRTNNRESAAEIIRSVVVDNKMVPPGHNLTFFIADTVVYPPEQFDMTRTDPVMKKSKILVTSKRVIFGYFENPIVYWGPYTAEARIWRLEHFIRCKTDADCLGGECDTEYGICTDKLVKAGDFCIFTCKDERFECKLFRCVRKESELQQFCTNEEECSAGYYCYKMQCVYTPGDVNDPCGYNDDCNTGLFCENGRCAPVYGNFGDDCSATGKCGIGLYCSDGICDYTNGGIGSGCDSNTDCLSGNICNFGTGMCEQGTYNPGDTCNSHEECGPGLICNAGKCDATNGVIGDPCGNDIDCGIGLICQGNTCQQGGANPGDTCDGNADCGNGLFCNLTLQPPMCIGEECNAQSDCGDGLICDMSLNTPVCIVTPNDAGEVCYTNSDCKTGFYCDDFKCTNGMNQAGSACSIQEDCGAGLICKDGACKITNGNPCESCYSLSDCNKLFPQGMTLCDDGTCYLPDNENGTCLLGYCECGPGFFCADVDRLCHKTDGTLNSFCNTNTDCMSSLECVGGFCTSTGNVNNTGICGDGVINFLTEQCEEGSSEPEERQTTCEELNCGGTSTVTCNPPGAEDECRWDTSVCGICPLCDYPPDCRENCVADFDETQALFNFWKAETAYYCTGRQPEDLLTPINEFTVCSLKLYSLVSYTSTWPSFPECSGIS